MFRIHRHRKHQVIRAARLLVPLFVAAVKQAVLRPRPNQAVLVLGKRKDFAAFEACFRAEQSRLPPIRLEPAGTGVTAEPQAVFAVEQ